MWLISCCPSPSHNTFNLHDACNKASAKLMQNKWITGGVLLLLGRRRTDSTVIGPRCGASCPGSSRRAARVVYPSPLSVTVQISLRSPKKRACGRFLPAFQCLVGPYFTMKSKRGLSPFLNWSLTSNHSDSSFPLTYANK